MGAVNFCSSSYDFLENVLLTCNFLYFDYLFCVNEFINDYFNHIILTSARYRRLSYRQQQQQTAKMILAAMVVALLLAGTNKLSV